MENIREWSPLIIAVLTLVSTVLIALLRSELREACRQAKHDAIDEMNPKVLLLDRRKVSRELYDDAMKEVRRRLDVIEEHQRTV